MEIKILSKNPAQTKKIGEILAREISEPKTLFQKKAVIIGLKGDLGGGKTTFLQGFAKGLGLKEKITSPTFVIMRKFPILNPKSRFKNFYHIDCYRIKKPKEILDLGLKKIISDPQNIMAFEWADRIKKILPRETISISLEFEFVDKTTRKIAFKLI